VSTLPGTGLGSCQTLVGDIVLAVREAIVDMPPTLPTPSGFTFSAVTDASSTLPVGTYYLRATVLNQWGETLAQAELSQAIVAGQGLQVAGTLPPGATKVRIYFGMTSGSENQFAESRTLPFTISAPGIAGQVPSRSTAYNPDMDGAAFSAASLFRWINDMLGRSAWLVGGFLDMAGVPSVANQGSYIANGQWRKIDTFWKDGYPLAPDQQGNYFFRNPITANVLTSVTTVLYTDRMMFQVWPQADRDGATTTLSQAMTTTDATAVLADTSGLLATAGGFVQVDSEIMMWSQISSLSLVNLIRGLGGTAIVAHAVDAPVTELNIWWKGYRMFCANYVPGQSTSPIPVPQGWANVFPYYALHRARLAEQETQQAQALLQEFDRSLTSWYRANKVTTGPRQVGQNTYGLEVIPTIGGGWVVPAISVLPLLLMHSPLDKWIVVCYLLALGGGICKDRISSMFSAIQKRAGYVTSVCPLNPRSGGRCTSGTTRDTIQRSVSGLRSFLAAALNRFLRLSKSVLLKLGASASATGSRSCGRPESHCSISDAAEIRFPGEVRRSESGAGDGLSGLLCLRKAEQKSASICAGMR
jgi:hypothetical protein